MFFRRLSIKNTYIIRSEPTAGYLIKLANLFNVSVDELLSIKRDSEATIKTKQAEINLLVSYLSAGEKEAVLAVIKEFLENRIDK